MRLIADTHLFATSGDCLVVTLEHGNQLVDKGMPIEQLQKLLGHQRIDTTLQYAMVKQSNVKIAHKRFVS